MSVAANTSVAKGKAGAAASKAGGKNGSAASGKAGGTGRTLLALVTTSKTAGTAKGGLGGKTNATGNLGREEDGDDTSLNTEDAPTANQARTTAAPTQKAVVSGQTKIGGWKLTPGQKLVLPDKLDLSMLKI
jgi:hypothetical protein